MRFFFRLVLVVYSLLCVFALLLIPMSKMRVLGMESDPLSGIFAYILGLPWTYLASSLGGGTNVAIGLVLLAAGMMINAAILYWLGGKFEKK